MRSTIDGTKFFDSKFVAGCFWGTVFQTLTADFSLPDDPEITYVFAGTTGATRNITLPRLIGNTAYGGQNGLTAAQVANGVLNGLFLELMNASATASTVLQAKNAAGDAGGANVGATIAIQVSATQYSQGQYQVIQGAWIRVL